MNRNGADWIWRATRFAHYARTGFRCIYCNARHAPGRALGLDHVVAREDGGGDHAGNVVTCCAWCNIAKGGQDAWAWLRGREIVIIRLRMALSRDLDYALGRRLLRAYREGRDPREELLGQTPVAASVRPRMRRAG